MRVVVAMVIATWAVLWAARGPSGDRRKDRGKPLGQRTCPRCHHRNTRTVLLAPEDKVIGTGKNCLDCNFAFDLKYWD